MLFACFFQKHFAYLRIIKQIKALLKMKNVIKTLFVAVLAMSLSFAFGQEKKTTKKTDNKTETKTEKTEKTTKKGGKKMTKKKMTS